MRIDGFDWDSGNLMKNEPKHGLTHSMIEAFFRRTFQLHLTRNIRARKTAFLRLVEIRTADP